MIKDSGKRQKFDSGMVRDVTEGKPKPHLAFDGPMFKRWVDHLTAGAEKYSDRNWMKANGQAEADRFRESAVRHFVQWLSGETDEDHAAAVFFNINGYEYVNARVKSEHWMPKCDTCGKLVRQHTATEYNECMELKRG